MRLRKRKDPIREIIDEALAKHPKGVVPRPVMIPGSLQAKAAKALEAERTAAAQREATRDAKMIREADAKVLDLLGIGPLKWNIANERAYANVEGYSFRFSRNGYLYAGRPGCSQSGYRHIDKLSDLGRV